MPTPFDKKFSEVIKLITSVERILPLKKRSTLSEISGRTRENKSVVTSSVILILFNNLVDTNYMDWKNYKFLKLIKH